MGSDSRHVVLSDVVKLRNGAGIKQVNFTEAEDGIPLVKVSNFTADSIDTSDVTRVTQEHAKNWNSHLIKENDVLIATVGSWPPNWSSVVGKVVRAPKESIGCIQNQNTCCLIPSDKVDKSYLYYLLKTSKFLNWVVNVAQGSANQARVPVKKLGDFSFELPSIEEQKQVASHLKALDDKILLHRQVNQTLEQMAQTLFKSWFVDFDPVIDNALDAESSIPEVFEARVERRKAVRESADFKPLPDDVRKLFPSEFEESELGWVPKGWGSGVLSDIARYGKERIDVESLSLDNYISTENMLAGRKGVEIAAKLPTVKTVPAYSKGYVLVSNIRPYFKKIWLANELGGYSNDVLGFAPTYEGTEEYLFNLLYQDQFFDYMMTTSKGSKMPRGDKKAIADWEVVLPPQLLMQFYSQQVASYYEQSKIRSSESKTLEKLRDTLLPKLISGELRLDSPEVEQAKALVN